MRTRDLRDDRRLKTRRVAAIYFREREVIGILSTVTRTKAISSTALIQRVDTKQWLQAMDCISIVLLLSVRGTHACTTK